MSNIKVVVNGVLGRMGTTVLNAVDEQSDMNPVGGVDAAADSGCNAETASGMEIPVGYDLQVMIESTDPDVVVDFSNAEGAVGAMRTCIAHGVRCVSGSTGISPDELDSISEYAASKGIGVISASNFALGCVVLIHLARTAARYFDYADLIESHHEQKIDAPSGTALSIVRAMLEGKGSDFDQNIVEAETLAGTRGGTTGGINVHSARMPGRVARHEVVFGALGQTLTLTHDSISRDSFMPGVMLAVRRVMQEKSMIVGLDSVLGL